MGLATGQDVGSLIVDDILPLAVGFLGLAVFVICLLTNHVVTGLGWCCLLIICVLAGSQRIKTCTSSWSVLIVCTLGFSAGAVGTVATLVTFHTWLDLPGAGVACVLAAAMLHQLLRLQKGSADADYMSMESGDEEVTHGPNSRDVEEGRKDQWLQGSKQNCAKCCSGTCGRLLQLAAVFLCVLSVKQSVPMLSRQDHPAAEHMVPLGPDGARLYFECHGSVKDGNGRPPIMLINGATASSTMWYHFIDSLASETRVCVHDMPGLGWSNLDWHLWWRLDSRPMSLYAHYVKTLAEREGFTEVDLVGHSMGSAVAMVTEALYPGLVRKVVALDWPHTPVPVIHGLHNQSATEQKMMAESSFYAASMKVLKDRPKAVRSSLLLEAAFMELGISAAGSFPANPLFAFYPFANAFYVQGKMWSMADLTPDGFPLLADVMFQTCGRRPHKRKSYLSVESTRGLFGNWEMDPLVTEVYVVPDLAAGSGVVVQPDHTNILFYKPFADLVLQRVLTFLRDEVWGEAAPPAGAAFYRRSPKKASSALPMQRLSVSGSEPDAQSETILADSFGSSVMFESIAKLPLSISRMLIPPWQLLQLV